MIRTYVKKPIPIQALQYTEENLNDVIDFVGVDNCLWHSGDAQLFITTLEGDMRVEKFAYVVKGPRGEFYPCRGDIFEETYNQIKN